MCRAHIFCKNNTNFYNEKCAHIHSYFYQVEYSVVHPQYDHIQSFLPLLDRSWARRDNPPKTSCSQTDIVRGEDIVWGLKLTFNFFFKFLGALIYFVLVFSWVPGLDHYNLTTFTRLFEADIFIPQIVYFPLWGWELVVKLCVNW